MGWGLVLSRSKSEKERTLCWEGNKGSYGVGAFLLDQKIAFRGVNFRRGLNSK